MLVRNINTSITIMELMEITEIIKLMDKILVLLSVTLWLIAMLSR